MGINGVLEAGGGEDNRAGGQLTGRGWGGDNRAGGQSTELGDNQWGGGGGDNQQSWGMINRAGGACLNWHE